MEEKVVATNITDMIVKPVLLRKVSIEHGNFLYICFKILYS